MLSFLGKKKLSAEQVSKQFIANLVQVTEDGFKELAGLINSDPAFVRSPEVDEHHSQPFLFIVLAANFKFLPTYFKDRQTDVYIKQHSMSYLNELFEESIDFESEIKTMQTTMSRLNMPSKNTLYAMPKALFDAYKLNEFQKEYFKNLNTPDPTFLKRMDELMPHFIWNWDDLLKKYKITQH